MFLRSVLAIFVAIICAALPGDVAAQKWAWGSVKCEAASVIPGVLTADGYSNALVTQPGDEAQVVLNVRVGGNKSVASFVSISPSFDVSPLGAVTDALITGTVQVNGLLPSPVQPLNALVLLAPGDNVIIISLRATRTSSFPAGEYVASVSYDCRRI